MATTLIIEHQYSATPNTSTLLALIHTSTAENPTIHTHAGTPGNQYAMYTATAVTSAPITKTTAAQYA